MESTQQVPSPSPHFICATYTQKQHCDGKCNQLHICIAYLEDNCKHMLVNGSCRYEHNVLSLHNAKVLQKYPQYYVTGKHKEIKLKLMQALKNLQPRTGDKLVAPTICTVYLEGRCTNASCTQYHPSYGTPYVWQYQDSNGTWMLFSQQANEDIETAYCRTTYDQCDVELLSGVVHFETMQLTIAKSKYPVRRLSTVSMSKSRSPYATRWLWHEIEGKNHLPIASSHNAEIEKAYLESKDIHSMNLYDDPVTINFTNMTITDKDTSSVTDIKRRPKRYKVSTTSTTDKKNETAKSTAPTICTAYLEGTCTNWSCTCSHPVYGTPFVWQYQDRHSAWRLFSQQANEDIETAYCRTTCDQCDSEAIDNSQTLMTGVVHFGKMVFTTAKSKYSVRRLSTPSTDKSRSRYATKWIWYEIDGKEHLQIASSYVAEIEQKYLKSTQVYRMKLYDDDVTVNFTNMTITDKGTSTVTQIKRRPLRCRFSAKVAAESFTNKGVDFNSNKCTEICMAFLECQCSKTGGDGCNKYHPQPKTTYVWRYMDTNSGQWMKLAHTDNGCMEERYYNPVCKTTCLTLTLSKPMRTQTFEVDFQKMHMTHAGIQYKLQRLSTTSTAHSTSKFATRWRWDYYHPTIKTKLFDEKATAGLESSFLNAKSSYIVSIGKEAVTITFASMTGQAQNGAKKSYVIMRRPRKDSSPDVPALMKLKNIQPNASTATTQMSADAKSNKSTSASSTKVPLLQKYAGKTQNATGNVNKVVSDAVKLSTNSPRTMSLTSKSQLKPIERPILELIGRTAKKTAVPVARMTQQSDVQVSGDEKGNNRAASKATSLPDHSTEKNACSENSNKQKTTPQPYTDNLDQYRQACTACKSPHTTQQHLWLIAEQPGKWKVLDHPYCTILESAYRKVHSEVCVIDRGIVNFITMTLKSSESCNIELPMKRLCPPYNCTVLKHDVHWLWYRREGDKWLTYDTEDVCMSLRMEKRYQDREGKGTFDFLWEGEDCIIDFVHMTETNLDTKQTREVRRRPLAVSDAPVPQKRHFVCTDNLEGKCTAGKKCSKYHCKTPYLWLYDENTYGTTPQWNAMNDDVNTEIEKQYSDAGNTNCTVKHELVKSVDFLCLTGETTIGDSGLVMERIDTGGIASCKHATQWVWFWKDDYDVWIEYDPEIMRIFEDNYKRDPSTELSFAAGGHLYSMYMSTMQQQNTKYLTKRPVRRRPRFQYMDSTTASITPADWLPSNLATKHHEFYDLFDLSKDSAEYTKIKALFDKTMGTGLGYSVYSMLKRPMSRITKITKIQNQLLWEDYCQMKKQMQKSHRKPPKESLLFHGTTSDIEPVICKKGFDWRMAGSRNAAAYGRGSYFARDASYSDRYAATDRMFVAQVLVGDYTLGNSTYQRPPPKDPQHPNDDLYDSCVNNLRDPSIFVVFDQRQAYPAYIVEYSP